MRRTAMVALLLLTILTGCGKTTEAEPVRKTFFAMDTTMSLTIYGEETAAEAVEQQILELEADLSVTDSGSQLAAVNRRGSGELTGPGAQLMEEALDLCSRTGGALDLSVYPVVKAWGFTTDAYRVPEEDELAALLPLVDYTNIGWDGTTVTLAPGMEIDLGSVTKGFAGRQAAQLLQAQGVRSAMLSLGGNIQTVGTKPDGTPWRIGIQDPLGDTPMLVLEVTDEAVVTSGGYERYFEQDGRTYWHIMDPSTGRPADSGLISVTVVGSDGLLCDGLSTALFVMGLDRAAEFWSESQDFEAVFVTEDGTIYLTQGLEARYALTQDHQAASVQILEPLGSPPGRAGGEAD